jgi:NADH-quinone oxidoreductase subunit N
VTTLVTVDWLALSPALVPAVGAVLVLLLDAALPASVRTRGWAPPLGAVLLLAGAGLALWGAVGDAGSRRLALCLPAAEGACLWSAGHLESVLQAGVLLAGAAALALLHDGRSGSRDHTVTTTLVLASASGGVAVAAARDLGAWVVALELATVPLVALVALRGTRRAGHGALTLLVTSLASFALLVLGSALWVTATGDASFARDTVASAWADTTTRPVLVLAATVLVAGLGFKLSLVPFHAWTPQAYSTADLGTAAFLAAGSKLSALAALLVVVEALTGAGSTLLLLPLAVVSAASLLLGNVVALRQQDPSRLLAWSTVAQAGWVVLPLAALTDAALRASAAYALVYATATVVAFAAVARAGAGTLEGHRGLLRRDPLAGGALALALLVLAGLPPGVIGLVAKVLALGPAVDAGLWALVAVAVVAVVIGIAVYLRWLAVLVGAPGAGGAAAASVPRAPSTRVVLVLGAAVLVVTSVLPHALLGLLG